MGEVWGEVFFFSGLGGRILGGLMGGEQEAERQREREREGGDHLAMGSLSLSLSLWLCCPSLGVTGRLLGERVLFGDSFGGLGESWE